MVRVSPARIEITERGLEGQAERLRHQSAPGGGANVRFGLSEAVIQDDVHSRQQPSRPSNPVRAHVPAPTIYSILLAC